MVLKEARWEYTMCGSLMQNLKSGKNTLWCQKSRKCSHLDMEGFFRGWYEQ